jgi:hypothetical protein
VRPLPALDAFFFASGRTLNLGLFRVLFACALWIEVSVSLNMSAFAIDGGFHLPYLELIPYVSEPTYRWIHLAQYPLIAALLFGLFTRVACGGLLLLQGYLFFADQINFRNHSYLFLLLLLLLAAAPADDALSLAALARGRWSRSGRARSFWGTTRVLTFQRLIQLQVCIVYFFAGLSKLYPYYLRGEVLAHQLEPLLPQRLDALLGGWLAASTLDRATALLLDPRVMQLAAPATVALELALPFALWWRRTRPAVIVTGWVLHAVLALLLEVYTFSLVMMASYLLFLDPEALPGAVRRLVRRGEGRDG